MLTVNGRYRLLDGSREIASALVDTTGTGEQFDQKATVVDNGTRVRIPLPRPPFPLTPGLSLSSRI